MIRLLVLLSLFVACTKSEKAPKKKTAIQEAVAAKRTTEEFARYNECKMLATERGEDGSDCEEMKQGFSERTLERLKANGL